MTITLVASYAQRHWLYRPSGRFRAETEPEAGAWKKNCRSPLLFIGRRLPKRRTAESERRRSANAGTTSLRQLHGSPSMKRSRRDTAAAWMDGRLTECRGYSPHDLQ